MKIAQVKKDPKRTVSASVSKTLCDRINALAKLNRISISQYIAIVLQSDVDREIKAGTIK